MTKLVGLPLVNASEIKENAKSFLAKCQDCVHSSGTHRCDYRQPITNADLSAALAGCASEMPTARNYSARIAIGFSTLREDSSWAETWKRLGEPCAQYQPIRSTQDCQCHGNGYCALCGSWSGDCSCVGGYCGYCAGILPTK